MPSLREQQRKFEHDLFTGVGTKQNPRSTNNTNQRIGKEELKEKIIQHRKQQPDAVVKPLKQNAKLSNRGARLQEEVELPYLYDTKLSHPIIEFKPSKEELKAASITPSFVLEVTWPRVIQFYHPSSRHCQNFHATYVNLARSIKRRSSRLPIEFHAVNCGVYREVCDQGFKIKSVPSFLSLKSGSIEGIPMFLPGDNEGKLTSKAKITADVNEKVEYISDVLGFTLDPIKGQSSAYASEAANNPQLSDNFDSGQVADTASIAIDTSGLSQAEDLFQDATSSFLATLSSSIYSKHPTNSPLTLKDSHELAEFVDLLRWAFPPETKVHTIAEHLKQEFHSITSNEEGLLKVLSRHMDLSEGVTWSKSCIRGDSNEDSYSCGIWSLLHIISVGVAERHHSVVGNSERVSVQHAGQSIRAFIDTFYMGCDSCKRSWLELYDGASSLASSSQMIGIEEQWKQLAIWIWEVHNEINIRRQRYKNPTTQLWPSREECPNCWPRDNGATGTSMDSFDQEALFSHLKKTYWISGHHNNRLIVIDRWSKAKRALSMKRLRDRMASHEFSIVGTFMRFLFVFLLVRAVIQQCRLWNLHARRRKRRLEAAVRDRGDDESTYYRRNKSSSTSRSRRSSNTSKNWPENTNSPANRNAFRQTSDHTSRRYRTDHRLTGNAQYSRYSPLHL
mmetsp:Transcript_23879/g.37434  ORF Transcript_23879/g.37434 Transcript_23879/m.37434 type:complete len:676 (-) Transcript_23879:921-2948(-)